MNEIDELWDSTDLTPGDLDPASPSEACRQFRARLIDVHPRVTSLGADWAVLTFDWPPGTPLTAPAFPSRWQQLPKITIGCTHVVLGTVAFRDGVPVIRVLAMREGQVQVDLERHPARPAPAVPQLRSGRPTSTYGDPA